jgi:hypothetical protein
MPAAAGAPARRPLERGRTSFDTYDGPDIAPERLQAGFAEHLALLIAEAPRVNESPALLDGCTHAQGTQHAHAVGLHRHSCTDGRQDSIALYEFRGEALSVQGSCRVSPAIAPPTIKIRSASTICTSCMSIAIGATRGSRAPSHRPHLRSLIIALPLAPKRPILPHPRVVKRRKRESGIGTHSGCPLRGKLQPLSGQSSHAARSVRMA